MGMAALARPDHGKWSGGEDVDVMARTELPHQVHCFPNHLLGLVLPPLEVNDWMQTVMLTPCARGPRASWLGTWASASQTSISRAWARSYNGSREQMSLAGMARE